MNEKVCLTGNEAIARGAYEAGVHFASAYPGTPSTEILESIAQYKEISSEWAPNEKVAAEAAIGASIAGARSIVSMKHVGVNVAADPLFTYAYTGVNGGMVIVSADEPGQHSSQNEQDNRNYARFMKIPLLEPADSQEAKDMIKIAFSVSEAFDTPVLIRMTTRVCHSKSIVKIGDAREVIDIKPYVKNAAKYVTVPSHARLMRKRAEERLQKLRDYAEETPLNFTQDHPGDVGVIASGICFQYAREVFGDSASYLKLGFTNPLPLSKIARFCERMKTIYIIEENDPYIEAAVRQLGFACHGKDFFPPYGEQTPDVLRKSLAGKSAPSAIRQAEQMPPRPPALCAGCPHRGLFYELGKLKNVVVSGDIGCYSLGFAPPYNAIDFNTCMGASLSMASGAQRVFDMLPGNERRVVGILGDSTFFHTGIPSLIETVYNGGRTVNIILDNRITGMTGHQENPGSGKRANGDPANVIDIEAVVRALGVRHVAPIDPNNLTLVKTTLEWALSLDEPSVIITRWPCALLKHMIPSDQAEFAGAFSSRYEVDPDACIGCKRCIGSGCPALTFDADTKKASIQSFQCMGCGVCGQICPVNAISVKDGGDA